MTPTAQKDLPCPFCGGNGVLDAGYVRCTKCNARGGESTFIEGAIWRWNTRAEIISYNTIKSDTAGSLDTYAEVIFKTHEPKEALTTKYMDIPQNIKRMYRDDAAALLKYLGVNYVD